MEHDGPEPGWWGQWPNWSQQLPVLPPQPVFSPAVVQGCVCPPGANKDCENPSCPRRNHLKAAVEIS